MGQFRYMKLLAQNKGHLDKDLTNSTTELCDFFVLLYLSVGQFVFSTKDV